MRMRTTLPPIAVIGAGFSGTMAALHLSRLMPERPVLLCEKSGAFERRLRRTAPRPSPFAELPVAAEPAPRPLELDLPDRKAA